MKQVSPINNQKSIEKYLSLQYTKALTQTNLGTYFAKVMEIPECIAEGKTPDEAFRLLEVSLRHYFMDAIENDRDIPVPMGVEKYSGKFVVRLKPSTHCELAKKALQKEASLNQVVNEAIESYLLQKA